MDIECTVTKHEQQMGCLFSAQINYSLPQKSKRKKCILCGHTYRKSGKKIYNVPLEVGSITGFSGKEKHDEMFFTFSSMVIPSTSFRLDLTQEKPEAKVFKETAIKGFDSADYSVEQVFYPSKDGTKIPMFIAYRYELLRPFMNIAIGIGYC